MAADVTNRLPSTIEASSVKRISYSTEIVRTDGGNQVTNQRWASPLAEWDINVPPNPRNTADYTDTVALFAAVKGSALTFNFHDPETCADVVVRIKGDTLHITGVGNMATIDATLEEAR